MKSKKAPVSLVEVKAFHEKEKEGLNKLGLKVEELLIIGRDKCSIPIYVTKMRVKSVESIYLKTKRKPYGAIDKIGDLVGLRALCLFEQDIGPAFEYIIELFACHGGMLKVKGEPREFALYEVTFFNWGEQDQHFANNEFIDRLGRVFNRNKYKYSMGEISMVTDGKEREILFSSDKYPAQKILFRSLNKGSGYKSIHFVVKSQAHSFEIQLRTLLQDVWGELEHSLAYKHGFINPLIGSNFQLFARELEAKDKLMSQLREIRDKDMAFEHLDDKKGGPSHWLGYEVTTIEQVFNTTNLKEAYREYANLGEQYTKSKLNEDYLKKLRIELDKIKGLLSDRSDVDMVKHWLAMENAFVKFCEGNHKEAEDIYRQEISLHQQTNSLWAAHYRLAEILLLDGQIESALECFDNCELVLEEDGDATDILDRERYYVNTKLAYAYWELGLEYIDIVLNKIDIAESFFNQLHNKYPEDKSLIPRKMNLLNNRCYYHIESWLAARSSGNFEKAFSQQDNAEKKCMQLEELLKNNGEFATSNMYDTIAWFYFNRYLEGRDQGKFDERARANTYTDIEKARKLLEYSLNEMSEAVSSVMSYVLRRRHAEAILVEYKKLQNDGLVENV